MSRHMRTLVGAVAVIGTIVTLRAAWPAAFGAVQVAQVTSLQQDALRRNATTQPRPEYPATSIAKGSKGVAVAELLIDTEGVVEQVRVVEAPDEHISAAVAAAVRQWRFVPLTAGPNSPERRRADGKLYFYFEIEGGKGIVLFPDEVQKGRGAVAASSGKAKPVPPPPASGPQTIQLPAVAAPEIREGDLKSRLDRGAEVIDVRDRTAFRASHRDGAKNIPADELATRQAELKTAKSLIVDCTYAQVSRCQLAARVLTSLGVRDVVVLVP